MKTKTVLEIVGYLALITVSYFAARIFGEHGVVAIMAIWFLAVSIVSMFDKTERWFALLWFIWTGVLIILYIWQVCLNV